MPFGTDANSSSGLDGGNQVWPVIALCNESNASGPSSEQTAQPLVVNRVFLPDESDERFGEDIRGGDRGSSSKAMALWHHHADEKELEARSSRREFDQTGGRLRTRHRVVLS